MAITIEQLVTSEKWFTDDQQSVELDYIVKGTSNGTLAREKVEDSTVLQIGFLTRKSIAIEPIFVDTDNNVGTWAATVFYSTTLLTATGQRESSFDIFPGTQHIDQSIKTDARYSKFGEPIPDFKGAIRVETDTDGKPVARGVDIVAPQHVFSETRYLADGVAGGPVTSSYRANLARGVSKVNNDTFMGFTRREVLFLGATGNRRGASLWQITFRFAVSATRENFYVGGTSEENGIFVIRKYGHDLLWVYKELVVKTQQGPTPPGGPAPDPVSSLVQEVVGVYVEQVYEENDFAALRMDG